MSTPGISLPPAPWEHPGPAAAGQAPGISLPPAPWDAAAAPSPAPRVAAASESAPAPHASGFLSALHGLGDEIGSAAQSASDWLTGPGSAFGASDQANHQQAASLFPQQPQPRTGPSPAQVLAHNATAPAAPGEAALQAQARRNVAAQQAIGLMPDPESYVATHRAALQSQGVDPDLLTFSVVGPHTETLAQKLQLPLATVSPLHQEALEHAPIERAVTNTALGLTSPENLALTGATLGYGAYADVLGTALTRAGLEPELAATLASSAPKLASLGFSAQQLASAAKLSAPFVGAVKRGDYQRAKYLGAEALLNAALGAAGAAYGADVEPPYLVRDEVAPEAAAVLRRAAQPQLERGIATGAGQPQPPEPNAQIIHQPPPPVQPQLALPAHQEVGDARFIATPEGTLDLSRAERVAQSRLPAPAPTPSLPAAPEPRALPPGPAAGTRENPRLMPGAIGPPPQESPAAAAPSPPTPAPQPPAPRGAAGASTALLTPGGRQSARYDVRELADLIPSHSGTTFAVNPAYPPGVQERDYAASPEAQARVAQQAQNLEPRYLLNTNPDAVNGPPVVTPGNVVLGGNSRVMSIQRAYGKPQGERYRTALVNSAAQFGLDPAKVAAMHQPVLVRTLTKAPATAVLASDLNRSQTGALSDAELAASRGQQLSPATLAEIGQLASSIGDQSTIANLLTAKPRQLMSLLVRDGVVTGRERPALQDTGGDLTSRGKDYVTRALVGSVLPHPQLIANAPANVLAKIARVAPQLAKLSGAGPEWDIRPALAKAVGVVTRAHALHEPVADLLAQGDMFGTSISPQAAALAQALERTPREFQRMIADYTAAASHHARGQMLLGAQPGTPQQALAAAVGARNVASMNGNSAISLAAPEGIEGPHGHLAVFYGANHAAAIESALGVQGRRLGAATLSDAEGVKLAQQLASGGNPELAQAVSTALARPHPDAGIVLVLRGDGADTESRLLEEHAHLLQATLSGAAADDVLTPAQAHALMSSSPAMEHVTRTLETDYGKIGWQALASEAGAHALAGDGRGLGLSPALTAQLAQLYIRLLDAKFGKERVDAALSQLYSPLAQSVLAARTGRAFRPGTFALDTRGRTAPAGLSAGPAATVPGGPRRGNAAAWRAYRVAPRAREPERGPLARVFAVTDKIGKVAGKPFDAALDSLSRTRGVSEAGKQALAAYDARRSAAALDVVNAGDALYTLVLGQLGPDYEADLPKLLKIEHAIERPAEVRLTPAEAKVRDALVRTLDAVTAHEVAVGLMRPEALSHGRQVSLESLTPGERVSLQANLNQFRAIEGGAEIPEAMMRPTVRKWLQDAVGPAAAPYLPHEYLDFQGPGKTRQSRLAKAPANLRHGRTFQTLAEAEAAGFTPNPDPVSVVLRRLWRSLQARNANELRADIATLGPEEFGEAPRVHGHAQPDEGMVLSSQTPLGSMDIEGAPSQVSQNVADAIERFVGRGGSQSTPGKVLHAAYLLERGWNFYNITKHAANIYGLAAMHAGTEGTRALATGRPAAAAGDAVLAVPLSFVADPQVMRGVLHQRGDLYQRAAKAGAIKPRLGAAAGFGQSTVPSADDAIALARRKVFGSKGVGAKLKRAGQLVAALPHWFTFDFFDQGTRLEMFRQLTQQGYSDAEAAAQVRTALVDYADRLQGEGWFDHVFYTGTYQKGAAKSLLLAFRRNPIAFVLMTGAIYGYEQLRNRAATGHAMAQNPPGYTDRYFVGLGPDGLPRYRRINTPLTLPGQLAHSPEGYIWNRLQPYIKGGVSLATNEQYPPGTIGAGGKRANDWHVVTAAHAAEAEAGNPWPAFADRLQALRYSMLGGPVQDVAGVARGKRSLADLLAPVSTSADSPYRDLYGDLQAAEAIESDARRFRQQGATAQQTRTRYWASLSRTLARGEQDLQRSIGLWQRLPAASRAKLTADANRDARALRGIERRSGWHIQQAHVQ